MGFVACRQHCTILVQDNTERSVFMGIFDHCSGSAFVRSHTDVGWEGLALSLHSNSSQRMQCSQTSTDLFGNRQTQPRPSDCQMEKRNSSLQRTRLHCSRVHEAVYALALIWRLHEIWRSVATDSAERWQPRHSMRLSIR